MNEFNKFIHNRDVTPQKLPIPPTTPIKSQSISENNSLGDSNKNAYGQSLARTESAQDDTQKVIHASTDANKTTIKDNQSHMHSDHMIQQSNDMHSINHIRTNPQTWDNTYSSSSSQTFSQHEFSTTATATSHLYRLTTAEPNSTGYGLNQSSSSISNNSNSPVGCDPSKWRTGNMMITE